MHSSISAAFAAPIALPLLSTYASSTCDVARRRQVRGMRRARRVARACAEPTPESNPDSAVDSAGNAQPPAGPIPLMSTATSSASVLSDALADAASRAIAGLGGAKPDVALVFVSARLGTSQVGARGRNSLADVVPKLRALLPALRAVLGCASDGVVGDDSNTPGVSLTLLSLPGIKVRSFHVMPDDLPASNATTAWASLFGLSAGKPPPALLVLADPTFVARGDLDKLLSAAHACDPKLRIAGAVASTGAGLADGHMLCTLPRDVWDPAATALRDSGLVALALEGDVELQPLVAPRVRHVGPVFTACASSAPGALPDLHIVGQPSSRSTAVSHLRSVLSYATPDERKRVISELHVGIADPDEAGADAAYVIRNVGSVDVDAGVIGIPAAVREGQSVRFYVKDSEAAKEALDATLQRYKRAELAKAWIGYSNTTFAALVFADAQRGLATFVDDDVGTKSISNYIPGIPVAGCISGAQIAPPRGCEDIAVDTKERSVVQNAASVIVLLRRRSGIEPVSPPESPSV